MQCYCMTEKDGVFTVGSCLHKCLSITPHYQLPCHVSNLEKYTCPPSMKGKGTLCSKCIHGYAYPAYSYKIECVICKNYDYNWLKYLAAAYLPLTIILHCSGHVFNQLHFSIDHWSGHGLSTSSNPNTCTGS